MNKKIVFLTITAILATLLLASEIALACYPFSGTRCDRTRTLRINLSGFRWTWKTPQWRPQNNCFRLIVN